MCAFGIFKCANDLRKWKCYYYLIEEEILITTSLKAANTDGRSYVTYIDTDREGLPEAGGCLPQLQESARQENRLGR